MFELSILKRPFRDDKNCMDYLFFTFLWFHFRWFLDCGDWFVYFEWWGRNTVYGYRFSSAGNLSVTRIRDNCSYVDENQCGVDV